MFRERQFGRASAFIGSVILVGLAALVVSAVFSDASGFGVLATFVSTATLVVSVPIAALTLLRDGQHRRVDRTLALHAELTTGDVGAARVRLARQLRDLGRAGVHVNRPGLVAQVTWDELLTDRVNNYLLEVDRAHKPYRDAGAVLRVFERADAANRAGALDSALFHQLICHHGYWWAIALRKREGEPWASRDALDGLLAWGAEYETRASTTPTYARDWGKTRLRDFGVER